MERMRASHGFCHFGIACRPHRSVLLLIAMLTNQLIAKRQLALLAFIVLSLPSWAQQTNFFTLSPKLKALLASNASARAALNNACAGAFSGRTVGLYYFYCDTDAAPRAYHFYPNTTGQAAVVICVRENQEPWDELITLVFELLNSKSEKQFGDLFERAKAGTVARDEFARATLRVEFEAIKATRDLVRGFGLSRKERQKSYYYNRFLDCPNDFDGFLSYTQKISASRDPIKDYEAQYDALRKSVSGD
jgi:hypothetical protein